MILDVIVEDKKKRLCEQKKLIGEEEMKGLALKCERKSISFYDALAKEGLSVIGEFKRSSPSHGTMNNRLSLEERIKQYNGAADAISCLTEEDHFNGSIEYLKQIRLMTELPIIRKDFIIDPYQVYEAKIIGADAILLIAAILDDETFKSLYELAYSLGLDVLCEVHDEDEMQRMLKLGVKIIGINNRNLKTFEIDLNTTKKLAGMLKQSDNVTGRILVSESGVGSSKDVTVLALSGADALLIGTVLMEADNPRQLVSEFKTVYDSNSKKNASVKVKICGLTSEADAELIINNRADYGGMVLYFPESKRNISIEKAKEIVKKLKKSDVAAVAVTVSPTITQLECIEDAGFDYIQIHGDMSPDVYSMARIPIIRAININKTDEDRDRIKELVRKNADLPKVYGVLLDAGAPGSGKQFDWNTVGELELCGKKLFLAGGLNPGNIEEAVKKVRPAVVDVSSGVEYDNSFMAGKDREKVKAFISLAKNT